MTIWPWDVACWCKNSWKILPSLTKNFTTTFLKLFIDIEPLEASVKQYIYIYNKNCYTCYISEPNVLKLQGWVTKRMLNTMTCSYTLSCNLIFLLMNIIIPFYAALIYIIGQLRPVWRSPNCKFFNTLMPVRFFKDWKREFCSSEGRSRQSLLSEKILAAPLIETVWIRRGVRIIYFWKRSNLREIKKFLNRETCCQLFIDVQ